MFLTMLIIFVSCDIHILFYSILFYFMNHLIKSNNYDSLWYNSQLGTSDRFCTQRTIMKLFLLHNIYEMKSSVFLFHSVLSDGSDETI